MFEFGGIKMRDVNATVALTEILPDIRSACAITSDTSSSF